MNKPNRKDFFIMKKIISIILVLATVMALFCSCSAKPLESGDYTYVVLEDETAKIVKYNGTTEIVTLDIPETIDDIKVTVIGAEAFAGAETITVVNLPRSITKIEEKAFAGSSIKKAMLYRSSVTEIGAYAFSECKNLVQVDMPSSLNTIGEKAFYSCDALKIATFRGNTENIDDYAFDACPKVKIRAEESLTNVIKYAETHALEFNLR